MQHDLMYELTQRGFINQCSNMDAVSDLLNNGKLVAYLGSDPTADSLHVGHLVPVMMMRWLQKYGHKPITLVGGATGRIGDPSGRDKGRPVLTDDMLASNLAGLKKSFSKFLHFGDGDSDALMVDNYDWMRGYSHMDFLVAIKLFDSKSEARRNVELGGIQINSEKITDKEFVVTMADEYMVQKGKKTFLRVIKK